MTLAQAREEKNMNDDAYTLIYRYRDGFEQEKYFSSAKAARDHLKGSEGLLDYASLYDEEGEELNLDL